MKEIYGIYSITNKINGKRYIGQTSCNFEKRWSEHARALNNNNHHNEILQRAWNKYGKDGFEFNVEHICDELDNLNRLEVYYIYKFNSFNDGYNLTIGGDGLEGCNEEERLENLKRRREKMLRDKGYTLKQIENVKILLSEIDVSLKRDTIDELVSKKTLVPKRIVKSIRQILSYADIKQELNDVIRNRFLKIKATDEIIRLFIIEECTIEQISKQLNLTEGMIKARLSKNKIKFSEINKERKCKIKEKNVIELYNKGERKLENFKKKLKLSDITIHKILDENGTSIRKAKKEVIPRVAKGKVCDVKGISWDISSKRWLVKHSFNKRQYVVATTKELEKAKNIKSECNNCGRFEELMKIKNKHKGKEAPKKEIVVLDINYNYIETIEGIGVASRKYNIPRKNVEDVLSKRQKSTYNYRFLYKEEYKEISNS